MKKGWKWLLVAVLVAVAALGIYAKWLVDDSLKGDFA